MRTPIVNDGPEDRCFGCGHQNPDGLRLVFEVDGDEVTTRFVAEPKLNGAPGVVHGGIQATLLDEVMGMAVHQALGDLDDAPIVTAELSLRYRRPVPTESELDVRATVTRTELPDLWVDGRIVLPDGTSATTASARWRRLG